MTLARPVPSYVLYGEDIPESSAEFGHIETIAARSSLHDWEIAPHRHVRGVQVMLVSKGQVTLTIDDTTETLEAPCHIVVPAGSIHGFRFRPETLGYVLMLSSGFAERRSSPGDPLLHAATYGRFATTPSEILGRIEFLCAEMLAVPQDWRRPNALFLSMAEALLRSLLPEEQAADEGSGDHRISHLRHLVELHFRDQLPVGWYAERLGMTARTLSRLCRAKLGCSPQELLHARLALEAQRLLCFANASVVQVSNELGFSDPSYFSRFYLRMTGHRPHLDKSTHAHGE
ncbi:MAG: AraC family transcriptional regulator [Novosphingobium lindaniclasticum]|jgi:AraC family transcriptional activator of pobA|uniref:helix-turn-helix domain-containing protein n=1 Tax=Novosphingobium lindaniclasticum TaxID=1329895 RepID=UPI002409D074|nr:helix-turn-helix domain-containing protein [Novosphingobium lindaniclasticum]MDF2637995.1 AraC family transcriptional regulator [Novosphingobium lindaniclasticum]